MDRPETWTRWSRRAVSLSALCVRMFAEALPAVMETPNTVALSNLVFASSEVVAEAVGTYVGVLR